MVKTRSVVMVLVAAVGLAAAAPYETPNPNTDQIIESLRMPVTRGIRPTNPTPPAPADVTASAPESAPPPSMASGASSGWTTDPPRPNSPQQTASNPSPASETPPPAAPSVNLTVQFATGSVELTPAAVHTLDDLGKALSSPTLSGFRFRIEGHTDTVGSRALNQSLSEARAAKALDYLASRWNVPRNRVETVGMGEDGLLVPTGPNVAESRNRRVTVINLGN